MRICKVCHGRGILRAWCLMCEVEIRVSLNVEIHQQFKNKSLQYVERISCILCQCVLWVVLKWNWVLHLGLREAQSTSCDSAPPSQMGLFYMAKILRRILCIWGLISVRRHSSARFEDSWDLTSLWSTIKHLWMALQRLHWCCGTWSWLKVTWRTLKSGDWGQEGMFTSLVWSCC